MKTNKKIRKMYYLLETRKWPTSSRQSSVHEANPGKAYAYKGDPVLCTRIVMAVLHRTPPSVEVAISSEKSEDTPFYVCLEKPRFSWDHAVIASKEKLPSNPQIAWGGAYHLAWDAVGVKPGAVEFWFGIKESTTQEKTQ